MTQRIEERWKIFESRIETEPVKVDLKYAFFGGSMEMADIIITIVRRLFDEYDARLNEEERITLIEVYTELGEYLIAKAGITLASPSMN